VSSGAHRSIDFANYAACIALKWVSSCRSQSEIHDTANSRRKKKKLLLITISLLLLFLASELAGKKLNNSLQGNAGVGANLSAYALTLLDDSLGIVAAACELRGRWRGVTG
jgi:hypothetical protein